MSARDTFDQTLPPAARALIASASEFSQNHLRSYAAEWERRRKIPREIWSAVCHEGGFGSATVPQSFGGAGMPFSCKLRIAEELASGDPSFSFALLNHQYAMARIASDASAAAKDELLRSMVRGTLIGCTAMTEPAAGSDFGAISTTARKTASGWSITGTKAWVTNAAAADVLLVFAQAVVDERPQGIAGFIVLRTDPGLALSDLYDLPGLQALGTGQVNLSDCTVPDHRLLYSPGVGARRGLEGLNRARSYVVAMQAGMLARALEMTVEEVRSRAMFGKHAVDLQGVRWSLANVATTIEMLRLFAYQAAAAIDAGRDAQLEAAMAKKAAGDHAPSALHACMQAIGARSVLADCPIARFVQASKAFCFADGATEIMNERVATLYLKGRP